MQTSLHMQHYIDGFVLPISRDSIEEYKAVATDVAQIWKEYGAIGYVECLGDDLYLERTRSFSEVLEVTEDEVVIFGWVVFPSKAIRDSANAQVPTDQRMTDLVAPLIQPERMIFNAGRMVYGGFQPLVWSGG